MGRRVGLEGVGKSSPSTGIDPRAVQLVASSYTDYAILDRTFTITGLKALLFSTIQATILLKEKGKDVPAQAMRAEG